MTSRDFGLVSVIMAAYNAEKTIEQSINSVLNQTYPAVELLVVDDYSQDRTVKLVENIMARDNRVRLIYNKENSGVSYTRKHGLEEAKGAWIAILDSDDIWAPEKLEKQIILQKKMLIYFLQVLLLWIRMVSRFIGIFMLHRKSLIVIC